MNLRRPHARRPRADRLHARSSFTAFPQNSLLEKSPEWTAYHYQRIAEDRAARLGYDYRRHLPIEP